MRVVLFRHGPAAARDADRWPDDDLRPLTRSGEKRTAVAAAGLARIAPGLTRIVASPLVRAQQTARLLADACGLADIETSEALSPGVSYRKVLELLAGTEDAGAVALVGHEPDLGKLAGTLLFGAPKWLPVKKAGACAMDFDGTPAAGAGRLAWFLQPRMLRRLARTGERV